MNRRLAALIATGIIAAALTAAAAVATSPAQGASNGPKPSVHATITGW